MRLPLKRYYLAAWVRSGNRAVLDGIPMDGSLNFSACYPPALPNGQPSRGMVLVLVATADHSTLIADARLDALPPSTALTTRMSALTAGERNGVVNAITRRGLGVVFSNGETWGTVLQRIGQAIRPEFTVDRMDIPDR